jgi:hypothetical protein
VTLLEPDVALTDFALALECAAFAAWLRRPGSAPTALWAWFVTMFVALGAGALLGGLWHGFIGEAPSPLSGLVWRATLLAVGVTGLATWNIGARLLLPAPALKTATAIIAAGFAVYAVIVVFVSQSFAVVVAYYLPAVFFVLAAFASDYARRPSRAALLGMASAVLTLLAAAVQYGGIGLHPLYFNHNALYHSIQAVALLLIFLAARSLIAPRPSS